MKVLDSRGLRLLKFTVTWMKNKASIYMELHERMFTNYFNGSSLEIYHKICLKHNFQAMFWAYFYTAFILYRTQDYLTIKNQLIQD